MEQCAILILVLYFSQRAAAAQEALAALRLRQDDSWISDRWWLDLAEKVLAGQPLAAVRDQFLAHGFNRAGRFVEKLHSFLG